MRPFFSFSSHLSLEFFFSLFFSFFFHAFFSFVLPLLGAQLFLLVAAGGDKLSSQEEKELVEDEITHSTGLEKQQLVWEKEGVEPFGPSLLSGPFGTPQKPTIVPSFYGVRLVGCTGKDFNSSFLFSSLIFFI